MITTEELMRAADHAPDVKTRNALHAAAVHIDSLQTDLRSAKIAQVLFVICATVLFVLQGCVT